jgi:hypothetical protein
MPALIKDEKLSDFFPDKESLRAASSQATGKNSNAGLPKVGKRSDWLKSLEARLISHLPISVLERMQAEQAHASQIINDMADIESSIDYVPLGIDDRSSPSIGRLARQIRLRMGLVPSDLLVGHFGLILDDLKRLGDTVNGFIAFALKLKKSGDKRRVVFSLVGKIIDKRFFELIFAKFNKAGLGGSLIYKMPAQETDFDAEIAACDAVFCMRRQQRGQVSHVCVRALSLGVPVLINRDSGYAYDPATTLNDDRIQAEIVEVLSRLLDLENRNEMRVCARSYYNSVHRADRSLAVILKGR